MYVSVPIKFWPTILKLIVVLNIDEIVVETLEFVKVTSPPVVGIGVTQFAKVVSFIVPVAPLVKLYVNKFPLI